MALALFAILGAVPAAPLQRFDSKDLAKAIAPFCDEQTVAIVHIDLLKSDPDQLADKISQLTPLKREQITRESETLRQQLAAFQQAVARKSSWSSASRIAACRRDGGAALYRQQG
jgi:hypothetical protein